MPQCKAFGCFNRQREGDAKGKSFFAFPKQNVYLKSAYGSFSLLFAAVKKNCSNDDDDVDDDDDDDDNNNNDNNNKK